MENTLKQTITREELLSYRDGTWIMTNHDVTKILDWANWSEPKPSGFLNGFWWRRKQLMDQLGMEACDHGSVTERQVWHDDEHTEMLWRLV